MSDTWLGIDIGTSGVKVVAVNDAATVLATATRSYPLHSPRPGWAEQQPSDWWDATVASVRAVAGSIDARSIAGIGLTGQMHGLVALDKQGQVLRDAILWNDNRNADECDWILEKVGGLDALLALTNNTALPGYTMGKILWLRSHEPATYENTQIVLNPKDYLRFQMTGDHATDVSDASGTGLLDVRSRRWSSELLAALDLPQRLLPPVVESCEVTGQVTSEAATLLGVPDGTPVVGGGGDSVLQTTAMGITSPGVLGVTIGTAGIVAAAASECPENLGGRLQVSCGNAPDRWHVMGTSLSAGGALDWWRQALAPLTGQPPDIAVLGELAQHSPVGARGLRFLPYLVGERCPHIDPQARAAWIGLDLRHDVSDMTRAVIEGALLNLRQTRDIFSSFGLATKDVRVSGGASVHPIWLQTLADVLGSSLHSVTGGEQGAAYGAALLAAVGTGEWPDITAALGNVHVTGTVEAQAENTRTYDDCYSQWSRLYPSLQPTPVREVIP
jgi:xylulokinase